MKRLCALLVLLSVAFAAAPAQEDFPIPPKRTQAAKFGGFLGFTPAWLGVNVDPVNAELVKAGGAALSTGGMWLWGGSGAVYIMFVPNLRLGGMGMGGSTSSTAVDAFGLRRDAEFEVGYGGITAEYVIPLLPRLDLAVGGMLGWGGCTLTLRQSDGSPQTWAGEWNRYGGNATGGVNISRSMEGDFFVWIPSVNLEYAFLGWGAVRAGVSYVGMSFPSWELDGEYDLIGVPEDVNGSGFQVNLGILVGTF